MNVMPDPVHLLLDVRPKVGIHLVASKITGSTRHAVREECPALKSRLPSRWIRRKVIARVGAVTLEGVKP